MSKKGREVGGENREDERDRISELADSILLHIMNFMDTESAVQTSVLSKRWKDLCKRLSSLTFSHQHKSEMNFGKFVSWFLSTRDHSYSLLNLTIDCWVEPELLDKIIKYALFHNIQQLAIDSCFGPYCQFLPLIFSCQSLTSLKLCVGYPSDLILPKSLHLPALKILHLSFVQFTVCDNNCAEPFSNCLELNTLVLEKCTLHNDEQVLCISNPTLSDLTILPGATLKILLSTPNLNCFTVDGFLGSEFSTSCNLSCLEEVGVDLQSVKCSDLMTWLQELATAKILTVYSHTFDLLYFSSIKPQPPCFVILESMKVNKRSVYLSDKNVDIVVEYLLQNSPMARVDIIMFK